MKITKNDTYKKLYDKVLAAKTLDDQEKLLLTCILSFSDTDLGFCYSNDEFAKIINWDTRKIQRNIDKLKTKKQIIIKRNSIHSPERHIYPYDQHIIDLYEKGCFGKNYILDYQK